MQTLNLSAILQNKFIGTDDLRKSLSAILDKLPKEKKLIITQNGQPKGALIDIETLIKVEELEDELADYNPELVNRVNAALVDAKKGNVVSIDEAFKELGI